MSILFNKVERRNPSDPKAPKRWYPVLKSTGMVKEKEVAKKLADETTLNPKEAEFAVSQLFKVVTELLLNGKTVQLGDLGSFKLVAKTEASDKKEEVTANKITKVNVRFTPTKELKDTMEKAKFIEISTLVAK